MYEKQHLSLVKFLVKQLTGALDFLTKRDYDSELKVIVKHLTTKLKEIK